MTGFVWRIPISASRRFSATRTKKSSRRPLAASFSAKSGRRNSVSRTSRVKKSELGDLIWKCYKFAGHEKTVAMLDKLKELGFREATKSGASIGIDDMIVPKERDEQIDAAQKQIKEVEKQYRKGVITPGERYNKIVDIWTHCTDQISSVMFKTLEANQGKKEYNPVYLMVDSGARGNKQQVRQLAGLRGLMAKPSGDIIEKPILANFREGLSVLEYFISTHGARKGLADTALKTADSGYMTRKLVDVSQDVIIQEADCGTTNGIWVSSVFEGEDEVVKLADRLVGRFACDDIINPTNPKEFLIHANEEIDEEKARRIDSSGVERVRIRSVLTCESKHGVCYHCYGRNLATGNIVKLGEAVGIIAAQSIGEPGTQLTMRTFHIGGTAAQVFKVPQIKAKHDGTIRYNELRCVQLEDGNNIVLNKNGAVSIIGDDGRELENHVVVIGAVISFKDGSKVKKGETFVQWDPYNVPILSEKAGKVKFHDIIEGVTMKQETDETTGQEAMVSSSTRRICTRKSSSAMMAARRRRIIRFLPARTSSSSRAARLSPARCWPSRLAKCPRPRTSPAACRAWPNCSRRAARRTPRKFPRLTASRISAERPGQALHSHQRHGDRAGGGASHSHRQACHRLQGRHGQERPAAHRRPDGPARNSRSLRTAGIAGAPRQRSAGGLSSPGRDHQRQAH